MCGEQCKRSDVDILVEFDKVPGAFGYMDVDERISKLLKCKVDLVIQVH